MAYILNIETSTKTCSVVLGLDNTILSFKESQSTYTHSESLTLFINEVLSMAKISVNQLNAISVSKGPGSYMGLRIGVSTAKGLCYALDIPLIAIDTLNAMALKAASIKKENSALYCPMIDARRMEVYCALFDSLNECITPTAAKIINEQSFEKELAHNKIYFFGDGALKCREVLTHPNALFIDDYVMSADALLHLSYEKYLKQDFENLAYFEPFYLKDFVPGLPRVKGLNK